MLKFYASCSEKVEKFRSCWPAQGETVLKEKCLFSSLSPQSGNKHFSERRVENRQRDVRTDPAIGGREKAGSLAWKIKKRETPHKAAPGMCLVPQAIPSLIPDLPLSLHPDNLQIGLQNYAFAGWLESGLLRRHTWCPFGLGSPETCLAAK